MSGMSKERAALTFMPPAGLSLAGYSLTLHARDSLRAEGSRLPDPDLGNGGLNAPFALIVTFTRTVQVDDRIQLTVRKSPSLSRMFGNRHYRCISKG